MLYVVFLRSHASLAQSAGIGTEPVLITKILILDDLVDFFFRESLVALL